MQALILAGGEGTRLRPLTLTIAKPVVPLVGRPFLAYMLDWLSGHGVDEVILSCGFLAERVRDVLGDGLEHGPSLSYLEEPRPLGTGGAVKFAQDLLDERFIVLNGDVLTDFDLTAQVRAHERTGAALTLALAEVADPSAYGLVRCAPGGAVAEFLEKPDPGQSEPGLINAGAYVVERSALDAMGPAGTTISIEREVFPALVGHGLYGFAGRGYWLDIGTPERYLQATYDILDGEVQTAVARTLAGTGTLVAPDVRLDGRVAPPSAIGPGCEIGEGAIVGSHTVLGAGVTIAAGARVEASVLLDRASVGQSATLIDSIIGPDAAIGDRCRLERAMLGQGAQLGSDNALEVGARIVPGVRLPEGAMRS